MTSERTEKRWKQITCQIWEGLKGCALRFRVFETRFFINNIWFSEVWIDTHYEEEHSRSINDPLILELLGLLNYECFLPQWIRKDGFQFYETDLFFSGKPYRLIWVIPPDACYIGVRNAYRRSK